MAIYNYDQAKSGDIYINKFDIKVGAAYIEGTIDQNAETIAVTVPNATPCNSPLVARFVLSDFAKAYVGTDEQESDVSDNDYTSPVVFTVLAEAGGLKQYTVTITFAA